MKTPTKAQFIRSFSSIPMLIVVDNNKVIAKTLPGFLRKRESYMGISKCRKGDEFDVKFGIKQAQRKCALAVFRAAKFKAKNFFKKKISELEKSLDKTLNDKYPECHAKGNNGFLRSHKVENKKSVEV